MEKMGASSTESEDAIPDNSTARGCPSSHHGVTVHVELLAEAAERFLAGKRGGDGAGMPNRPACPSGPACPIGTAGGQVLRRARSGCGWSYAIGLRGPLELSAQRDAIGFDDAQGVCSSHGLVGLLRSLDRL